MNGTSTVYSLSSDSFRPIDDPDTREDFGMSDPAWDAAWVHACRLLTQAQLPAPDDPFLAAARSRLGFDEALASCLRVDADWPRFFFGPEPIDPAAFERDFWIPTLAPALAAGFSNEEAGSIAAEAASCQALGLLLRASSSSSAGLARLGGRGIATTLSSKHVPLVRQALCGDLGRIFLLQAMSCGTSEPAFAGFNLPGPTLHAPLQGDPPIVAFCLAAAQRMSAATASDFPRLAAHLASEDALILLAMAQVACLSTHPVPQSLEMAALLSAELARRTASDARVIVHS